MLWACIHLPLLPLEVVQHQYADVPLVIEETSRSRRYVAYANSLAQEQGIHIGSSIPTAHSLVNGLVVKPRHPALEQQGLDHIATLGYGFTPTVSIQKPNQVLLEIESSLRLFKGFDALNQKLCHELSQTPYFSNIAYYSTAAGAMALAHAHPHSHVQGEQFEFSHLKQCPLRVLDINHDIINRLKSMGINRVGDLFDLPNDSLGKRFGHGFVNYLKQLSGEQPANLPLFKLPPLFDRGIDFVEELTHTEALLFPCKRLVQYLQHYLIARQLYVRSFVLTLHERFNQSQSLVIQLSKPHNSAQHLLTLIQHQFEKIQLTQPVIGVHLKASWFAPMDVENQDLFSRYSSTRKDQYQLIDTLASRLGKDRVHGLQIAEDHRPENAWKMSLPGEGKTVEHPSDKRPLWLLNKPQPLRSKKGLPVHGECLQLMKGPERIETGWWDHAPIQRDYFIALHPNGSLLWIFKDLQHNSHWYLHGLFS